MQFNQASVDVDPALVAEGLAVAQVRHQEDLSELVAFGEQSHNTEVPELSNAALRSQEQVASQFNLEASGVAQILGEM